MRACPFFDGNDAPQDLKAFIKERTTEEITILPDGIEFCHNGFTIDFRNQWMLERSGFVITYINHSCCSAKKFCEKAKKQGKNIINIAKEAQAYDP